MIHIMYAYTHTHTHTDPGTCFLCNECPSDTEETVEGEDCVGRPRAEGSAACVETTAYALLALRAGGETQGTVCLARWLVRIRSGNGGYWSSQVGTRGQRRGRARQ